MLAALRGEEVDHVPVGLWHHFSAEVDMRGSKGVEAQCRYFKEVDTDFVKVLTDGLPEFPVQHITTAEQWGDLKPLPLDHPWVQAFLERSRQVARASGDVPVFHSPLMPFTTARYACERIAPDTPFEEEFVMKHLRQNPQAVMHGLDAIAQTLIMMFKQLIHEGDITGFFLPVHGAEFGRFTPEEYRQYVTPSDLAVITAANELTDYNILHCCSHPGIRNNLEIWKNYPSPAVNWAIYIDGLSLLEGKTFFQGKTCMGGFQNTPDGLLCTGTKAEIQEYTKDLITQFGKQGLILGADCSLPTNISSERVKWVIEAARQI